MDAPTTDVSAKRTNAAPLESGAASSASKSGENAGGMGSTVPHNPSITVLLPIMGVVLVAFLVIGLALPVLPLHVHQGLGLSTFVVGLVTGSQFAASLISRVWSGHYADRRGAKRAVVVGLLTAVAGGLLYLSIAPLCRHALAIRHDTAIRPRVARRSGELRHHGRGELGTCPCRTPERRTRHSLGWDVDVRGPCVRGAGRHHALHDWRISSRSRPRRFWFRSSTVLLVAPLSSVPAQRGTPSPGS